MNFIKKILHSFYPKLFYLIVFLIPSQLAYHFWPQYSFVYGLRIDYLSVAVYLTDILIFVYIIFFFLNNKKKRLFKKEDILSLFVFIFFVIINIFYSKQKETSFFKWIKILEYLVFSFTVSKNKLLTNNKIYKTFCYSVLFFGMIGFLQVIKGSTLGGLFYFLGERSFSFVTPGISLLNIFNLSFLKPYSTFSHPNSFAGYLLVVFVYLWFWKTKNNKNIYLKYLTIFFIFVLLLLTFSKGALFSFFIILTSIFFNLLSKLKRIKYITLLIIITSVLLPIISVFLLRYKNSFSDNVSERLLLSEMSGQMLKANFILGIGLNNFINYLPKLNTLRVPFWFLQPVHNIFLLFTIETGLVGIGIFFLGFNKYINYLIQNNKKVFIYILLSIFMTGFFDHYWLTLQQNMLLMFLFLGLSKNKQIK